MKYVIIGASAAGLAAAQQIRVTDSDGEITVLTREAYLPYSRPSISYLLKGTVEEKKMFLKKPQYYSENNINIVTSAAEKNIRMTNSVSPQAQSRLFRLLKMLTGVKMCSLFLTLQAQKHSKKL